MLNMDPYASPSEPKLRVPVWGKENRLADEFISRNEETDALPPLHLLETVYLLTWRDGRPLFVRQGDESAPWNIPTVTRDFSDPAEGEAHGEKQGTDSPSQKQIDRWLKRTAKDLWGIQIKDWFQNSRLRLTAMEQAMTVEPGSVRYHSVICASASGLADLPSDATLSRRLFATRDLVRVIREQHHELVEILEAAHESYLVRQAQQPAG